MPQWSADAYGGHIQFLGDDPNLASLTEHLLKWHKGSRPVYALASPPCEDQPEAQLYSIELTEMIERNAIAGTDNWYLPKTRQAREVCWMLEDAGLVDSAKHPARGWQLADGVLGSDIRVCWRLSNPVRVLSVRDVDLADMTCFELIGKMQMAGWSWRAWVPQSARKKGSAEIPDGYAFGTGQAKEWFSGKTVVKQYLLVLLDAERLAAEGLKLAPHGKEQQAYQRILDGDFRVREAGQRRNRALVSDVAIDAEAPAKRRRIGPTIRPVRPLADATADTVRGDDVGDVAEDEAEVPFAGDFADEAEFFQVLEAIIEEGAAADSGTAAAAADADTGGSACSLAGGPPAAAEPPPPLPPPAAPPPVQEQGDVAAVPISTVASILADAALPGRLTLKYWGIFTFYARQPSQKSKFGGYFALCRLHQKTPTAKCTIWFPRTESTVEHHQNLLRRAMHWCNSAHGYTRARHHCEFYPSLADIPSGAILASQCITKMPVGTVWRDDDLDAVAMPPARASGAASSSGGPA